MKYPKEYLDEIKNRLKVSTLVSKSVNLKKRGKEFVGLSPFKNEKTPSFTVNDEKGFYHCFSSGEHGNIFDFLMKTQNLKFGEAVRTLANFAGMRPYTFSKADEEREKEKELYISIYLTYIEYYHQNLIKNSNSSFALEYLKKRNLTENEIKKFKIGYIQKNPDTLNYLRKNFGEKELKDSGLFYFDEKRKTYVDRFRERIIFPINNISGKPIGIGGRAIIENNYSAKYINSPETKFFKKGSNLYNLDFARKLSNKLDDIYLVEGYMDVVGLNKNGIENAVANLGTSLTDKQIQILNQFFNNIIICFDGDDSGYKAAVRAAENIISNIQPEKKISFLFLPENEDPDSFSNKHGKEYFLNFSKQNSLSIHNFLFNHYKSQSDNSPSSLAEFEKKLRLVANSIKDNLIKKYILEYFLEKISQLTPHTNSLNKKKKIYNTKSLSSTKKIFNDTKTLTAIELKEYAFLYLILNNLNLIKKNLYLIDNVKLFTTENKIIFSNILEKISSTENLSLDNISIDKKIIERIFKFAQVKYITNFKDDDKKILDILMEIVRDLKNYELEYRIEELESKFSRDLSESTFNEIRKLKKLQKFN